MFFLERLQNFDLDLFVATDGDFWNLTQNAHFDMFLVRFYSLIAAVDRRVKTGQQPEISLTLPNFYIFLKENAKTPELQGNFISNFNKDTSKIHEKGFEIWVTEIRSRLEILRNKLIAHLDTAYLVNPTDRLKFRPISLSELSKMMDDTAIYFDAMSFNHHHVLWFWDYFDENRRAKGLTDLDELLNLIAMNSPIIARSQEHPESWAIHRRDLTDAQIAKINDVRRKMGLPDVE